jgi:hypothetical protein
VVPFLLAFPRKSYMLSSSCPPCMIHVPPNLIVEVIILIIFGQVTVAARSVFARSDAGIVGSNPTQGMDVWCVYAFILCCCPVFR